MKKQPWCIEPFIGINYQPNGKYQLCCIAKPDVKSTIETKVIEWWNSKEIKQIREDMINHHVSDDIKNYCEACITSEELGIKSRRQERLSSTEGFRFENIIKHMAGEDYDYQDILTTNFKALGNLCNLKCFMCGPKSSSKIAADYKKIGEWKFPVEIRPYTPKTKESYFDEMKKIISNLKQFHFLGGEPLIHPDFPELISIAAGVPNAKDLIVEITTNATTFSEDLIRSAEKFKAVLLIVSIDGVGERGSYVRNGLKWNEFDKNIREFRKHKNITLLFRPTISNLTLGYIDELYDYMSTHISDIPKYVNWNCYVVHPDHHRAVNIPKKIKEQYVKKLNLYGDSRWSNRGFDSIKNCLSLEPRSHEDFLKGIKKLKYWDSQRKTNLLDHFPEFTEYYELL